MTDPLSPEEQSRRKRRLALLVAPLGFFLVLRTIGVALAPTLVKSSPIVLIVMAPLFRHLVLVSNSIDTATFFAVSIVSLFLVDPFGYMIGREYGEDALAWVERRSGRAGRLLRWGERLFERAGPVVLFFAPGPVVCMLAGAARMRVPVWAAINLTGTFCAVLVVRIFGEAYATWIEAILSFIEANVVLLTVVSIVFVVISTLLRRRQLKAAESREAADDVVPSKGPIAEAGRGDSLP